MRFIAMLVFGVMLAAAGSGYAQEAGSGWLGAELKDLTKEEADALGWEAPRGAKVVKPVPGGPAEAAGLQPDDILLSLDGVEIENVKGFIEALSKKTAGTDIRLAVSRGGREKRLGIKLAERPAQFAVAEPKAAEAGPVPMLDTGGHMAMIITVAFTPDGKQLVSASEDKTIRVWDVATGKTVRTIRGEVAPGQGGKIYAMALSPDGKLLAVGGLMDKSSASVPCCGDIRLYDFASGKLVVLLKGHENAVLGLAFSPDGRHLISGSADNTAVIWDVETRQLKHRLRAHKDFIYAVGFTPDGLRAVTGSYDHDLRLWRVADGGEIAHMPGHGDKVRSLAVAADGAIASGDKSGEIRLWDGKTGTFAKVLARQKTEVGSLSFSPDGRLQLSGRGSYGTGNECHVYDLASGREIVTYRGHNNAVIATAISPNGRWAVTGGGDREEIHIWDLRTGERRPGPDGKPLTLGGRGRTPWAVGFAADGRQIGWGNLWTQSSPINRGPLQYVLTLPSANDRESTLSHPVPLPGGENLPPARTEGGAQAPGDGAESHDKNWRRAVAEEGGWVLSHRKGGKEGHTRDEGILDIKQGGRVVASIERGPTDGYGHRAYSFTADGETIISGGANGVLTAYDRAGKEIGEFIGHEGDVWAVATSPDGRYLVSASADQTQRLWNLKTRELLVTLFYGSDGEWVMWTPQGYYAASGPGAELIGWQINRGAEHEADYVNAAQLRKSLHRPDIVARAIQLASAEAAVKEAYGTNFKLADLLAKPVPRFRIVSPAANATVSGGKTEVEIALEATPDPVKLIRIQVNDRQIAERQPDAGGGFQPGTLRLPVPLAKGRNTIRLVAVNDTGETPAEVVVTHDGDGNLDKRGTLYILAIGVDKYPSLGNICGDKGTPKSCDLSAPGADAKSFAETMAARLGPLHQNVVQRVLVNGGSPADVPTAANILDTLGMLGDAGPADTVLIFLSGHGMNEGPNYNFLATDAALSGGTLRIIVVSWANFQVAIEGTKGRRILFLDTCHAGNSYNQRLGNDSYQANIIVYSAARWDQLSWERSDLGHGLFTYAVVEGMNGAAKDQTGEIRTEGLRDYLRVRVQALAKQLKQEQEPQYFRGRDAENYVLARGR